jgi:hypothetical protein
MRWNEMREMDKQLEYYLDIRNTDVDIDMFARALVLKHMSHLIAFGGTYSGLPDPESALLPDDLKRFLARATADAQRTGRFVDEWRRLAGLVPYITSAWELGHSLFQQALINREYRKYFTQMDFVVSLARSVARKTYERDTTMRAWLINGYLKAWLHHFFPNGLTPV